MGLDIYLYDGKKNLHFGENDESGEIPTKWFERDRTEAKSQKYPTHYCERTDLRSSYNGSGFNRVVGNLIGKDFYYVFGEKIAGDLAAPAYEEDGVEAGELTPDEVKAELREALVRAQEVTHELKAIKRPLRLITIAAKNYFDVQAKTGEADALKVVNEELDRYEARPKDGKDSGWGGSYGNNKGDFFLDEPLKVIAAIPGVNALGTPSVHLVYDDSKGFEWYVQAAEICEEFIEYALTLENPRVSWSG
jgi:hypothetical protein